MGVVLQPFNRSLHESEKEFVVTLGQLPDGNTAFGCEGIGQSIAERLRLATVIFKAARVLKARAMKMNPRSRMCKRMPCYTVRLTQYRDGQLDMVCEDVGNEPEDRLAIASMLRRSGKELCVHTQDRIDLQTDHKPAAVRLKEMKLKRQKGE